MFPTTTQVPTTTHTPTTEFRFFNHSPSSDFDVAGKKRFTGNVSLFVHVWTYQKNDLAVSSAIRNVTLRFSFIEKMT